MQQKFLKPYHLFKHQGSWYVINIEGMFASTLDEATARTLERITAEPGAPLQPHIEEQLQKLDLLSEKGQIQKNEKEIKTEAVPVVNMSFFLTQSCNLNCVYCYGDGGKYGTVGNMEEKTALQAVDWLLEQSGKMKKVHIGFFGGEPFLNFSLMKTVVEYAEKKVQEVRKKVDFNVTTNATLLDDEKIAFFKKHQVSVLSGFNRKFCAK